MPTKTRKPQKRNLTPMAKASIRPGESEMPQVKYIEPYKPLPWQIPPWHDTSFIMLLSGAAGGGKDLRLSTPIPTPFGWTTMGDIDVGDVVFDERGLPTRVTWMSDVHHPRKSYRITFDDGSEVEAGADHQWFTYTYTARQSLSRAKKRAKNKGGSSYYNHPHGTDQRYKVVLPSVVTTEEILNSIKYNGKTNHAVPVSLPLQLPEAVLPVDPYVLGIWLAEGISSGAALAIAERDLPEILDQINAPIGTVTKYKKSKCFRVGLLEQLPGLRAINVSNNKHIPDLYLRSSYDQRMRLLQGIVDGDGYVNKRGQVSIDLSNLDLVRDVRELVVSLGIKAGKIRTRHVTLDGREFVNYRLKFMTNLPVATVKFKRKRLRIGEPMRDTKMWHYITDIEEIDDEPMKCIAVDSPSRLYLCGNSMIPTHNSRAAGEKIHAFCLKYPGATGMILRKSITSLTNSTIAFMKQSIIGNDQRVKHVASRKRWEYENGSILAYGGMNDEKQREKLRSVGQKGGLDFVWLEEATEFNEEDFNEVIARMRGKAASWRQLLLTTNPDAPGHWINIRLILGNEASVYLSSAKDNPHNPPEYVKYLNKLTGVQYRRLVLGEWAAGSGRVIDTWDDRFNINTGDDNGGNVSLRAEYKPDEGPVIWALDDGYSGKMDKKTKMYSGKSHPRAILLCQLKNDGSVGIFAESYAIKTLAKNHVQSVIDMSHKNGWPLPMYVVRDRAAASIEGILKEVGLKCRFNSMTVEESIKVLREAVAADENEVRQVFVHPRCFYIRYEMLSYSYDNSGRIIKEHDHGPDALRYLVQELLFGRPTAVDIATISSVMELNGEAR